MRCLKISLVLMSLIQSLSGSGINLAMADSLSVEKIVESVQKTFDATRSFQGSFKQFSTIKSLKRKSVSSGYVFMKKGGKMRWEYKEPDEQYIISDGKTYWFYIPEDGQAMKKEVNPEVDPASPSVFLTGEGVLSEIFTISIYKNQKGDPGSIYLKLVPIVTHPNLLKLILGVDKGSFRVRESIVHDYYGNITRIVLTEKMVNGNIDDSLFFFSPPGGVQVITE